MSFRSALFLVLALVCAACAAEPLDDATYEAVKLCGAVDLIAIDDCGRSTVRSPEHTAARKAVGRMFDARTEFMNNCLSTDRHPSDCPYIADWHMLKGSNRAGDEYWKAKGFK